MFISSYKILPLFIFVNIECVFAFNSELSIVMDYKDSDPLPAVYPTIWVFSRFSHLVIHYSGFLCDNIKKAAYFLHSKMWTKSSNTVITTINNYLTSLFLLNLDMILGIDSHSTNVYILVIFFVFLVLV
jgi:hypothetical protein